MSEALSFIASPVVFPPSATTPLYKGRRLHRRSSSKSLPNPNSKPKPQYTSIPPLLSSSRREKRQSLVYYAELASKLAEDGRFEDFLMVSESMVASGVKASEFSALLNAKSVARGVARMIRERKLDSVVELLFNGIRKLDTEPVQPFVGIAVDAIREECGRMLKCGEVDRIVDLMETLHGLQFPIQKLAEPSRIINLCIKKRNPMTAIRYAQIFPHMEILFCTVILEFGKKGDLISALRAFEASKHTLNCINMHAYRTIIDVCGLCGDYLKSRTIFEELLASKVTPNTYVFNSLMNVNAGDLHYTMNMYKQMRKLGVTADITSHNILLKSCCLAAKVELARDIYKDIRDLESKGALKLDVFTYSTMIKVFADAKMWKLALEIKEDMTASGVIPNTVTWSSLINACANAGLVEQAVELFEEMLLAGGQPNSQCINILLHACVEACQFDRAFRLFQCWKEKDLHQTTTDHNQYNAEEFIAIDQMKKSTTPYRHLTVKVPFRPTTSTYNIMMKACGTDYFRAKALMGEMKTLGLSPNNISWSILIDICGDSGNVATATQILSSMHETGIQPDVVTYTTAIKVCVKHNNPKLAFLLFAEMEKYQVKPNMVTYNTILRARTRYGSLQEVQQCLLIYQDMRKAGYKSNDYYLKQLIEEWCEGVIQNRKMANDRCSQRTHFRPESILLEKVAEHLQEKNADSLSIDLRGLTKVEARIVVLAVLRKIKEKYIAGDSVKDDVLIILGVQELYEDDNGIREAVIRLLHHDLGLQVLSSGSRTWNDKREDIKYRNLISEVHEDNNSLPASRSPSRRPVALQRLKVTRESLQHWLQRRIIVATNQSLTYSNAM